MADSRSWQRAAEKKMPRVEFTDDLITDVDDIDRHHRALIGWANRLFDAEQGPDRDQIVERTLNALTDYISYHFAAEEQAMEQLGYDGIESHKERHRRLTREVDRLTRDIKGLGVSKASILELHFFVEDWIRQHIKHVDGAFASWIKKKTKRGEFRLPEPSELKPARKKGRGLDNVEVVHSAGVMTPSEIRARLKY